MNDTLAPIQMLKILLRVKPLIPSGMKNQAGIKYVSFFYDNQNQRIWVVKFMFWGEEVIFTNSNRPPEEKRDLYREIMAWLDIQISEPQNETPPLADSSDAAFLSDQLAETSVDRDRLLQKNSTLSKWTINFRTALQKIAEGTEDEYPPFRAFPPGKATQIAKDTLENSGFDLKEEKIENLGSYTTAALADKLNVPLGTAMTLAKYGSMICAADQIDLNDGIAQLRDALEQYSRPDFYIAARDMGKTGFKPWEKAEKALEDTQGSPGGGLALFNVRTERALQDQKWGEQNHVPERWLTILLEELGESAKARLENDRAGYRNEMIQVAAVAVAAVECLDRNRAEEV